MHIISVTSKLSMCAGVVLCNAVTRSSCMPHMASTVYIYICPTPNISVYIYIYSKSNVYHVYNKNHWSNPCQLN